jgi:hypothetical protein
MSDSDSRVRYYACESLYNVTKVTRDNIMCVFNEIFVSMTTVITDLVPIQSYQKLQIFVIINICNFAHFTFLLMMLPPVGKTGVDHKRLPVYGRLESLADQT